MRGSMLVLSLCVVMTASCSRSPTLEYSFDLSVDGRPVIKEKGSSDENFAAMQDRHRSWLEAMITACEFSKFLSETFSETQMNRSAKVVTLSEAQTHLSAKVSKGKQNWTLEREQNSQTQFAPIEASDKVVVCRSGLPGSAPSADPVMQSRGCSIQEGADSSRQPQYPLQLRAFLQSQHGMRVGAAWRHDILEKSASGENTRLIRREVRITQDGYVCVQQLKSNLPD